ncbi:MAG: SLATT domain-containing protein [Candidatus Nitrosopolaris sp.]
MSQTLTKLQSLIYVIGGIGTFLAAVGLQLWVALTTTLIGVLTTFLEYRQLENNLMKNNQAATSLDDIKVWWVALSSEEKVKSENVDKLVGSAETILQGELASWVQQMENALAKITKQESSK